MKKKWLAAIALSLLFTACGDDNSGNIASTASIDDSPTSSAIESSAESSSAMSTAIESSAESSAKTSSASSPTIINTADETSMKTPTDVLGEYAVLDSYDGGFGSPDGFSGGFGGSGFDGGMGGGFSEGFAETPTSEKGVDITVIGVTGEVGGTGDSNNRKSGLLTAGEWNDFDNWGYWTSLLNENKYYDKTSYWKFYPKNLVAVQVVDGNNAGIANATVELLKGTEVEFATKTDNSGFAYCWIDMFNGKSDKPNASDFSLKINGVPFEGTLNLTTQSDEKINVNVIASTEITQAAAKADIAFIVDATGSMSDEIRFLISDLEYIIDHANSGSDVALRTAALFYRDEKDDYLTRYDDFSDNVSKTQEFVSQQKAGGGGDYPEAVHTALEESLQKLSWNESARARIAFLILDAPAHHKDNVIESLQKSIKLFAQNGIKIIPVAASGVDKDTEFMLRFFELATGGTYVFLTNDSGIGNEHIEASVGDYEVEKLADLMVRLIKKYVK